MRPTRTIASLALAVLWASSGHAHQGHDHSGETLMSEAGPTIGAPIFLPKETQFLMDVLTVPCERVTVPEQTKVLGRVRTPDSNLAVVHSPFTGRVTIPDGRRLPVVGDTVNAGDPLVLVEQWVDAVTSVSMSAQIAETRSALELAKEELHHAQIELERVQSLGDVASERRLAEARAGVNHARVNVDGYTKTLKELESSGVDRPASARVVPIAAPISGTIANGNVVAGEYVRPEETLFEIVDTSTVWIAAELYESDLAIAADLAGATIALPGGGALEAEVHHVAPRMDAELRTLRAVFQATNADGRLREGMFVDVHVHSKRETTAVALPASSIIQQGGMQLVYVKTAPETFLARAVETSGMWEDKALVVEGLTPGEPVVTQGVYQLRAAASQPIDPKRQQENDHEESHEH